VLGLELLGQLVGFCSIRRHPYRGAYPIKAEWYINVLARDEAFTGLRPEPGLTSGFILLRGAREQVAVWGGGSIWALVWEDNGPSRTVFAAHGFETFAPEGPACQTIQLLRPGLPLPRGAILLKNARATPPLPS
jgi:hypothetical protein